jgi:serine/threonine-protein kinase
MASASSEGGEYRVIRRIAVGGMAEIFEAAGAGGERVVLKMPLPQYGGDARFVEHLEHEAELNARLDHPNLVRVKGIVTHRGSRCIVMELVDGVALSELRDRERLPVPIVVYLARELLAALVHVHEAVDEHGASLSIVHRDVTPENVLLTRDGRVKLGDFGIARSSLRDARTRTGIIKGKLQYLAPEQVTGSTIDARTDLYALAVVLFELLTHERWLEGDSEIEVLRRAEDPPVRPLAQYVDIDRALAAFVERNLARFAEERYPSARAALKALDAIAEKTGAATAADLAPIVAEHAPAIERAPAPAAAPRRSSGLFVWIAVGLGTAGVAVAIATSGGEERAPEVPLVAADRDAGLPRLDAGFDGGLDAGTDAGRADAGSDGGPSKIRRVPIEETMVEEAPDPIAARRQRAQAQLDAIRPPEGLSWTDLSPELQAERRALQGAIRDGDVGDAEQRLAALGPAVAATAIDRALVERKLNRVNALIRRTRERGGVVSAEVDALAAEALRSLVERDYVETNATLNRILASLRSQ